MKIRSYLTMLSFVICMIVLSCVEQGIMPSNTPHTFEQLEMTESHDTYCNLLCDSIATWRSQDRLNESRIEDLWTAIHQEMETTLDLSSNEIDSIFTLIDISESNYTSVYEDKYPLLNGVERQFLDDLESLMLRNFSSSDQLLLDSLEFKRVHWKNYLQDFKVDASIDIAKSSMIYWKNNIDCVLDPEGVQQRWTKREKEGARLAMGDVTGALWGTFGGLAGALLGAVGGTLGTALQIAIFD